VTYQAVEFVVGREERLFGFRLQTTITNHRSTRRQNMTRMRVGAKQRTLLVIAAACQWLRLTGKV